MRGESLGYLVHVQAVGKDQLQEVPPQAVGLLHHHTLVD